MLRREGGHLLRMALDLMAEDQGKKWRPQIWKNQDGENRMKVALCKEDALSDCQSFFMLGGRSP